MKRSILLPGVIAVAMQAGVTRAEPGAAVAPGDESAMPGLRAYERDALARNPTLQEKRLAIERAGEEVHAARAAYLPQIDVSVRYTELLVGGLDLGSLVNPAYAALNQQLGEARFPTDLELHLPLALDAKIELRQPIFAPAASSAKRLAVLGHSASQVELVIAEREIASAVRTAYLAHARAAQVATLLAQSRPMLEENLRISERLTAVDKRTADAVFRARAELAGHDQTIAQVAEATRAAARAVNQLRGAPGDDAVQAPAGLSVPAVMPAPLAAYVERARRDRAELRLIAVGRAVAGEQRTLVRTGFWPTLAVALDYGFQSDDLSIGFADDYASVSVLASWNMFDGRRDAHRSRARELDVAASDAQRRRSLDQIETEVRNAYGAAALAIAAVAAIDARIASAQAAYDLVATKYAAGTAPQIEVIAARTALLQARADRITAATDYHARIVELDRVAESTTHAALNSAPESTEVSP